MAGILQGRKKEEILKMGLANGGSVVGKIGAKEGLLFKSGMDKWIKRKLKTVEETIGMI